MIFVTSLCKIFVDDTSLFSKVHDIDKSAKEFNSDLEENGKWTFQWKMPFDWWRIQAAWETGIRSGHAKSGARKPVFKFPSFNWISTKKCVEVAINDFTMHLIVSKWLIMQKRRQKRKTMRERGWSERRNCQKKYFDPFNYVADHANIRFFLNVNSLHCFFWFDLYYLLHLLSSNCFANPKSCSLEFFWIYEFFKKWYTTKSFS